MWAVAKALQVPFDFTVKDINDLPFTISYVIRKRAQLDGFMELPKDKRPTERMIWDGKPEEIERWLDRVFDRKPNTLDRRRQSNYPGLIMEIDKNEIEG